MRSLGAAAEGLADERRSLEREWDRASTAWRDARQAEFERTVIVPIVRSTATMIREMEVAAENVEQALRLL